MNPNVARRRHAKAAQTKNEVHDERDSSNGHGQAGHTQINVGAGERRFSLIGGTALAVCGLLRGSLSGVGLAALGGALIWRGYTGHCSAYQMLGYNSAALDREQTCREQQICTSQSEQRPPSQEL